MLCLSVQDIVNTRAFEWFLWTGQGHIWLTLTYAIIYGMLIISKTLWNIPLQPNEVVFFCSFARNIKCVSDIVPISLVL